MKIIALVILLLIICFSAIFAQTMTEVKTKDLPKVIEKYVTDNIPGGKIYKAVKVSDKGTFTYNVAVDVKGHKYIYIFNKDGKFIKKGDEKLKPASKTAVKKGNGQKSLPQKSDTLNKTGKENTPEE